MSAGPRLPEGFHLVALDRTGSTNEEAKRRAEAGAADRTVVWAREQTAGKGRRERVWRSGAGNLSFSLLLRPEKPLDEVMQCSFVAANAVADAVAGFLGEGAWVACKWPNDVLVGGNKTAGILLEAGAMGGTGMDWLVIGIGVNVAEHPTDTEYPATSLAAEGGDGLDAVQVLEAVCLELADGLALWQVEGFRPVRGAWLERAHGLGGPITVRLEKETIEGTFADLDTDGAFSPSIPETRISSSPSSRMTAEPWSANGGRPPIPTARRTNSGCG